MPQTKIYGHAAFLQAHRSTLSDVLQSCMVDALNFAPEKRFQRFFPMAAEDFIYPSDKSDRYLIIEISLFEGRSIDAKKALIRMIYDRLGTQLNLDPNDIEILIHELPPHNWAVRGLPGDELNRPTPTVTL